MDEYQLFPFLLVFMVGMLALLASVLQRVGQVEIQRESQSASSSGHQQQQDTISCLPSDLPGPWTDFQRLGAHRPGEQALYAPTLLERHTDLFETR